MSTSRTSQNGPKGVPEPPKDSLSHYPAARPAPQLLQEHDHPVLCAQEADFTLCRYLCWPKIASARDCGLSPLEPMFCTQKDQHSSAGPLAIPDPTYACPIRGDGVKWSRSGSTTSAGQIHQDGKRNGDGPFVTTCCSQRYHPTTMMRFEIRDHLKAQRKRVFVSIPAHAATMAIRRTSARARCR
jgi:hypothetical protein